VGTHSLTATQTPKTYTVLLAPPADAADYPEMWDGVYVSFDTFDFDITPGEGPVTFTIHAITIDTIPVDSAQTGQVLASWDFEGSSQDWYAATDSAPIFTVPQFESGDDHLSLAATDDWTFGYWLTTVTGLGVSPGTTLRLRATLSSPITDSAHLPLLRVRMTDVNFEQIGELVVQPWGPSPSLPNAVPQTYDLYYVWPDYAPALDTVIINCDLVNLSGNGQIGGEVHLDDVSLETVQFTD
jgi:hypothetical protein